jgi:hypothetical protein
MQALLIDQSRQKPRFQHPGTIRCLRHCVAGCAEPGKASRCSASCSGVVSVSSCMCSPWPKRTRQRDCGKITGTAIDSCKTVPEPSLISGDLTVSLLFCWRPRRDLNPCYRRERGITSVFAWISTHIHKTRLAALIRCAAPPWVPRPQRARRAAPTRATLPVLTPTWPMPA